MLLVDNRGAVLADPSTAHTVQGGRVGFVVGFDGARNEERMVYALPVDVTGGMPSVRYQPPWSGWTGENVIFGMSFENVIPPSVGILIATLNVFENVQPPPLTEAPNVIIDPVEVRGRRVYARVRGGLVGTDYLFLWQAFDYDATDPLNQGNVWSRTALVLSAYTS